MSAFEIYFLDVGQGDCSLICPPDSKPVLVDCKSAHVARSALDQLRVKELEAIIISHLDEDHIEGMVAFIKGFIQNGGRIDRIFIDTDRNKKDLKEAAIVLLGECIRLSDELHFELQSPRRTSSNTLMITEAATWRIELISPQHALHLKYALRSSNHPNALSVVIRIQCFGKSILIGADAPLSTWEHVEKQYLPADIFRVPHHGANIDDKHKRWSSMSEFYQEVSPTLAIVSVGTRNGHSHPTKAHVNALPGPCRKLCTQLTKQCHDDPINARPDALMNIRRTAEILPYRHEEKPDEVPCAGSIMVRISPDGNIETFPPANDWHDEFIRQVPRALCRA